MLGQEGIFLMLTGLHDPIKIQRPYAPWCLSQSEQKTFCE